MTTGGYNISDRPCSKCGQLLHLVPMDVGYCEYLCPHCELRITDEDGEFICDFPEVDE